MAALNVVLQPEYGYVILIIMASVILLQWLGIRVGMARKKYDVKTKFDTHGQSELLGKFRQAWKEAFFVEKPEVFRVTHVTNAMNPVNLGLNSLPFIYFSIPRCIKSLSPMYLIVYNELTKTRKLEVYPLFLVLIVFAGLLYPKLSAVAGGIWIVARVLYALGYYTGDPEKRVYGAAMAYIGLIILLVSNVILGLKLIGLVSM